MRRRCWPWRWAPAHRCLPQPAPPRLHRHHLHHHRHLHCPRLQGGKDTGGSTGQGYDSDSGGNEAGAVRRRRRRAQEDRQFGERCCTCLRRASLPACPVPAWACRMD